MSLRAWLAARFSILLVAVMVVFIFAIYIARQAGAYGEAAELAQERARLAQLILRQVAVAGAPITVRERREDTQIGRAACRGREWGRGVGRGGEDFGGAR